MASITKIRRHYDNLDNQERLRLAASAINRGDTEELEVLAATTSMKTYTMPDAWVGDRYHALWDVGVTYWLITEELFHKREAARHTYSRIRVDIEGFRELAEARDDIDDTRLLKIIKAEIDEFTRQIYAASQAVKKLSREVNLSPDELIAHTPEHVKKRLEIELLEPEELNEGEFLEDGIELFYTVLASYWPDHPPPNGSKTTSPGLV